MMAKKPYLFKKSCYDDICMGVRKIVRVGNSYGVSLPKKILVKNKIMLGEEFVIFLVKRTKDLTDELSAHAQREYVQYRKWSSKKDREIQEAVDEIKRRREQKL